MPGIHSKVKVLAVQITTCMGRGHIVAAALQAAQLVWKCVLGVAPSYFNELYVTVQDICVDRG